MRLVAASGDGRERTAGARRGCRQFRARARRDVGRALARRFGSRGQTKRDVAGTSPAPEAHGNATLAVGIHERSAAQRWQRGARHIDRDCASNAEPIPAPGLTQVADPSLYTHTYIYIRTPPRRAATPDHRRPMVASTDVAELPAVLAKARKARLDPRPTGVGPDTQPAARHWPPVPVRSPGTALPDAASHRRGTQRRARDQPPVTPTSRERDVARISSSLPIADRTDGGCRISRCGPASVRQLLQVRASSSRFAMRLAPSIRAPPVQQRQSRAASSCRVAQRRGRRPAPRRRPWPQPIVHRGRGQRARSRPPAAAETEAVLGQGCRRDADSPALRPAAAAIRAERHRADVIGSGASANAAPQPERHPVCRCRAPRARYVSRVDEPVVTARRSRRARSRVLRKSTARENAAEAASAPMGLHAS